MKYIERYTLLWGILLHDLCANEIIYNTKNEPAIINDLLTTSDFVSPNIINLCSDLYSQGYDIKYSSDDNIGIYLKDIKLIEIPLDCHQPTIEECIELSGMKFTNTQYDNAVVDLYFNILGFNDREYNNIFETNDDYKHINFNNMKYSYPLFKIKDINCFNYNVRKSLRNIIYTDPGKLLMYRLFLASNYLTVTEEIETDHFQSLINLGESLYIKYPIIIKSNIYSKYSYSNNFVGISFENVSLYCELQHNISEKFAKIGLLKRPVETSIYHELVHCFHYLYFNQLNYNNEYNNLLYLFNNNMAVKQTFNLFCEYNNIEKVMDKQKLKTIFNSLALYRGNENTITSNEEFTTIMGIYPNSEYYYPGAELSENLFRIYVNLPIRDSHVNCIQSPYVQNADFINNVKNNIINLKLKYSTVNFYTQLPDLIRNYFFPYRARYKNIVPEIIIKNIALFKYCNQNAKLLVKGYNNCYYKTNSQEIINNIEIINNNIDLYPKDELLLPKDIDNIIDIMYPEQYY